MKKVRIGVNGFGRIGRTLMRCCLGDPSFDFVAINELADVQTMAHLVRYDSVHGRFDREVSVEGNDLVISGDRVRVFADADPESIPWGMLGVDVVVESTGKFTDRAGAERHLKAGARRVLISAPAEDPDVTIVYGVNEETFDREKHRIVSNASCTTNCAAPVAKVLHDTFGVKRGFLSTTHSLTNDQRLIDQPHKDLRRGRAAGVSMIPTKTGAAKAIGDVLPHLKGKFDGIAIRVPVGDVSLIDFVLELEKTVTVDDVNGALEGAAREGRLKGILDVTREPLVSVDLVGVSASAVVDLPLTRVLGGNLVKVFAWYDNEWGYACRCRDVAKLIAA
ncbi:MAG TPA: type I glyceraldehyde-3-phosphate dehydrogenase [Thermoanaerobaculia bacterium]|jgi:glyceraldehyde 3-phosphate dehydrogenase|nr:type I glyceraldehyde-3-phosphate dehydrogenase [Thermoanaerobaculia bacterium]